MARRPVILTLLPHYLPGYKYGGPVRSIANLVSRLGDEFDFRIVTRDRDFGDAAPYRDISARSWRPDGLSSIYYAPAKMDVLRLIRATSFDAVYLNSFFSPHFSAAPLLARRFGLKADLPVILATRGELAQSALALKSTKKSTYITFAKTLSLHDGLTWQASSEHEASDIQRAMGSIVRHMIIAPDLAPQSMAAGCTATPPHAPGGPLRVVFLSRITPVKNLHFALDVLADVTSQLVFDIYGPIEDGAYWHQCEIQLSQLPANIRARYLGPLPPSDVPDILGQYDLFFLPTAGENYGHVIAEALCAGIPVLISSATPWRNLERDGLGWDLPLTDRAAFVTKLTALASGNQAMTPARRATIQATARQRLDDPRIVDMHRHLFLDALSRRRISGAQARP